LLLIGSLLIVNSVAATTFDPMLIGAGARSLGMGKAYVAIGEDGDTIFNNPAGLGEIDSFKFISMSGKILEDASYTMLGWAYPLGNKQAFGIGYVGAQISGIELREADGTFTKKSNFGNNLLFLSYGKKISEQYSLGINLKYFYQDGSETNDGDGVGSNLDVGILQSSLSWISFGLVGQNILSSGKVRYAGSQEESLSRLIKVGTKMYLLGEKFNAAEFYPVEFTLAADATMNLEGLEPVTLHIGAELSPIEILTLRAGMDQDPIPGGVQSNLTSGVSLKLAGVGFHYAYHPYTGFAANTAHYLSISFDERGWPYEGPSETFLSRNSILEN